MKPTLHVDTSMQIQDSKIFNGKKSIDPMPKGVQTLSYNIHMVHWDSNSLSPIISDN